MRKLVLLGWFFLAWGASDSARTQVGPFNDQASCERVRSEYMKTPGLGVTHSVSCWYAS